MKRGMIHIVLVAIAMLSLALPATAAQAVYWVDAGTVYRAGPDGTGAKPILTTFADQIAIDPMEGRMYLTGDLPLGAPLPTGRVWRAELDGSGQQTLVESWAAPVGIALEPTGVLTVIPMMFWADRTTIQRANHEGEIVTEVVKGLSSSFGMAFDPVGRQIYWTQNVEDGSTALPAVQRANMDGSDVQTLVTVIGPATGITIDPVAGKMYWGYVNPLIDGLFPGSIQRANLDGTDVQTVVSGLIEPIGVALDGEGRIYWTDSGGAFGNGSVHRAWLDGSAPETLASKLVNPRGIAVLVPEPSAAMVLVAGSALILQRRRYSRR